MKKGPYRMSTCRTREQSVQDHSSAFLTTKQISGRRMT